MTVDLPVFVRAKSVGLLGKSRPAMGFRLLVADESTFAR
jgi:hypothetical protein